MAMVTWSSPYSFYLRGDCRDMVLPGLAFGPFLFEFRVWGLWFKVYLKDRNERDLLVMAILTQVFAPKALMWL